MASTRRDRPIIEAFLRRRAELGGFAFDAAEYPEDAGGSQKVIDCVAPVRDGRGARFLVEHTEVLTYPEIIEDGKVFERWVRTFGQDLEAQWPGFHLHVTLPYEPGKRWPKDSAEVLRAWLLANVAGLAPGHRPGERHDVTIPGVPSPVRIWKYAAHRPLVIFSRVAPKDVPEPKALAATTRRALDHKYQELADLRAPGATTVLLLENRDVALLDDRDYDTAFRDITSQYPYGALDEVWLAATWEVGNDVSPEFYCLRGPAAMIEETNPFRE
jgi:hypothetical protein